MIPVGVIIPYNGSNSNIPTGFVRDTRFDERFPVGATSDWGSTGGSTTHSHGNLSHTHDIGSHTHSGQTQLAWCGADTTNGSGSDIISYNHRHTYSGDGHSAGTTATQTIDTIASNLPLYYNVIFIRAISEQRLPANSLIWSQKIDSERTLHAASQGRFLRGAANGANAGGTGGSNTHSHSLNHIHSVNGHTHSITTNRVTGDRPIDWSHNDRAVSQYHTHTQTLASSAQAMNSYSGSVSGNNIPAYATLNVYEAVGNVKAGDIAIITDSTNPTGWVTCDGTNGTPNLTSRYILNTSAKTSTVSTGGSNTHDHGTWTHYHTGNGTHTHGDGGITNHEVHGSIIGNGTMCALVGYEHTHGDFTCSSTTADYTSTSISIGSVDSQPPYIKVRFIMATNQAQKVYVTVNAGTGGTVSPGSSYVNSNIAKTYTITPDNGKIIKAITVDGIEQTITDKKGMSITITPTTDTTINVTFKSATNYGEMLFPLMRRGAKLSPLTYEDFLEG